MPGTGAIWEISDERDQTQEHHQSRTGKLPNPSSSIARITAPVRRSCSSYGWPLNGDAWEKQINNESSTPAGWVRSADNAALGPEERPCPQWYLDQSLSSTRIPG